jgi:hypothetical protein
MIRYSSDGNSLIGVDDKGKEFSHSKTDSAWFSSMLITHGSQQQNESDNAATLQGYKDALQNIQGPLDAGQFIGTPVAPPKPQCKFIDDMGKVTYGPFDPPLADLVIPKTTPTQINTPGDNDLTAYDMLSRIYHHMFD